MNDNIFDKLRTIIAGSGNAELVKFEAKPLTDEDTKLINKLINTVAIPSSLENQLNHFIKSPKYLHLVWQDPENEKLNGEISLYNPLLSLLTTTHNLSEWSNIQVKESADSKCCRIEDRPYMGDGCLTLLTWDKTPDHKVFYRSDYILYELFPSFERYCETLCLTMGYIHWQFLLCPGINSEFHTFYKDKYQKEMVNRLPDLFPLINSKELKKIVDQF